MAGVAIRVEGLEKTLKSLNKEVKKIRNRSEKGIFKAALFLRARAQEKVPVDLGNLKSSAFTVGRTSSDSNPRFKGDQTAELTSSHQAVTTEQSAEVKVQREPSVSTGFSAFYALFVHENMEAKHTVGEAKFLENAINENLDQILRIIAGEVRK